ncbi:MAG: metallophosphoesterase family protein [Lewinellaceae bacterium]|nr:metallophosphoesterase family protein [Saprospiraceae bacterium]MCB9345460.1 metallophosphoesterase family protein [Lewinellaceae bacterium]
MTRIGLLSDTHSFLDERVFKHFAECDEIWHAGDFGSIELIDKLREFKPLRGVYGNIDGAKIRLEMPLDLRFECDGVPVFMTHIGGYPGRYDARVGNILRENPPVNGIFISGHSHILKVMPDKKLNFLHINPGACGNIGWHKVKTLIRFTLDKGKIQDMQVIELGSRGIVASDESEEPSI